MTEDLMIDTETLNDDPDAVVLSIAVVPWSITKMNTLDELLSRSLYLKLDIKDQKQYGRTIGKKTIDWWKDQTEDAKAIIKPSPDDVKMRDALVQIADFIKNDTGYNFKRSMTWFHGTEFDYPIIKNMYRTFPDIDVPISQWSFMDTKSIIRWVTGDQYARYTLDGGTPPGWIAHNALHDAALMCMKMQEIAFKTHS